MTMQRIQHHYSKKRRVLRGGSDGLKERSFDNLCYETQLTLMCENSNGNRYNREEEKDVEKINHINCHRHMNMHDFFALGKEMRKKAEVHGFKERIGYEIERFEAENGPTIFGAGYGVNQDKTQREFFEKSSIEYAVSEDTSEIQEFALS